MGCLTLYFVHLRLYSYIMITHIRVASQQLEQPRFESPKELVSWMGAIQAQEYEMAKWAIGIRLRSSSLEKVNEALYKGDILRTHVMRPTWHFVAAEDIRWMLMLSSERIKAAVMSYAKGHFGKIEKTLFTRCLDQIGKILEGYKSLTKQEVTAELQKSGILPTIDHVNLFLTWGEVEGIVCSGIDKGKKTTYALLDERVPPTRELCREEALARLASRYFQSHSPAQLQDFVWWSGLTATECRLAINLIKAELMTETFDSREYFIHQSWKGKNVRRQSRYHKRCGTNFLFIVIFLSIIFFMFLHFDNMWLRIISRIVLVPVIAGVSYEFIRFAGNSENKFVSMLCKPGMLLQMLTTREPDNKMIEVAIASVEEVFDWREYQRRCIAAVKSRAKLKEMHSTDKKRKSRAEIAEEIKRREAERAQRANERAKYIMERERREAELEKLAQDAKEKRSSRREEMLKEQENDDTLDHLDHFFDDEDKGKEK
mgnify:CR=1 FL=1